MSLHSKWEARIKIPTGDWTGSLTESGGGGAQTITFSAANTYYWSSAGNDSNDLAAALKAKLDAASVVAGNSNTYTVAVALTENGTGLLTISVDSGTFTLTSVATDMLALMGFASDLTPTAASFAGTLHVEGAWLPDCPVETPYHLDSPGRTMSNHAVTVAPDGTYYAFHRAAHVRNEYVYAVIRQAKAIAEAEGTAGESYASFWADAIRGDEPWAVAGRQLRFYKDTDVDGTYKTYNVLNVGQPDYTRHTATYEGYWTIRLEVAEN